MTSMPDYKVLNSKKPKLKLVPDKTSRAYYNNLAIDILARTMYGEACQLGESYNADVFKTIACVVINRYLIAKANKKPHWWGNDIISICQKPYQFQCWNRSSPFYKRMVNWNSSDPYFAMCLCIAENYLKAYIDLVNGATHYHLSYMRPGWTDGSKGPCFIMNNLLFYKLG